MDVSVRAEHAGRRADDSPWMDRLVRVGLGSYGVVHLIIAWLALRLAFGHSGGKASSQGALQQLAQNTFGLICLYVVGVGFFALVVWQGRAGGSGPRPAGGGDRAPPRGG